jgi:hypothetical protein
MSCDSCWAAQRADEWERTGPSGNEFVPIPVAWVHPLDPPSPKIEHAGQYPCHIPIKTMVLDDKTAKTYSHAVSRKPPPW